MSGDKHLEADAPVNPRNVDLFALEKLVENIIDRHRCTFDVSKEEADNISHLGGLINSLRTSDTSGLDIIRDNHMWTRRVRAVLDRVWWLMLTLFITSAGAGVLAALWQGLKAIVKE